MPTNDDFPTIKASHRPLFLEPITVDAGGWRYDQEDPELKHQILVSDAELNLIMEARGAAHRWGDAHDDAHTFLELIEEVDGRIQEAAEVWDPGHNNEDDFPNLEARYHKMCEVGGLCVNVMRKLQRQAGPRRLA